MGEATQTEAERAENEAVYAIVQKRRRGEALTSGETARFGRWERKRNAGLRSKAIASTMQKELCSLLDTSRKMILQWQHEGMPRNGDNTYDLSAVMPWLKDRWLAESKEPSDKDSPEMEKLRRVKRKREEIKLARERSEVVDRRDITLRLSRYVAGIKQKLLGLPNALAPACAGREAREIKKLLDLRIREAVAEFAELADG